ncbi:MAG: pirin family protein [Endomicrobiales bacterium]|jgi:redox-sensitive bicupin YhaK (pirin superfamily)
MKKFMLQGRTTYDGAGVKLDRIFAHDHTELTDPFLLLDHFGSNNPDDYIKGFPWHPHRGIETVTYMLDGLVEHGDSLGNAGTIRPGDIQWMTAGGGVIHQEMPKPVKSMMHGLQLWVNLPATNKMMAPRYRGIVVNEVPIVKIPGGEVRVIAGKYENANGPVRDLIVDVEYLDVRLHEGALHNHRSKKGYTSFCYVIEGSGEVDGEMLERPHLFLCTEPGSFNIKALSPIRYIFVTGQQIKEPVAWGGPIVMNTEKELQTAFAELDAGTFIKKST